MSLLPVGRSRRAIEAPICDQDAVIAGAVIADGISDRRDRARAQIDLGSAGELQMGERQVVQPREQIIVG